MEPVWWSRSGVEPPTGTIHPRQIPPLRSRIREAIPEMNLLIDSCFLSVVPLLSRGWSFPVGGSTPDRHFLTGTDRRRPTWIGTGTDVKKETRPLQAEGGFRRLEIKKPGGVLLSRGLFRTTIGDEAFHRPVRDGEGWFRHSMTARQTIQRTEGRQPNSQNPNPIRGACFPNSNSESAHGYGIKPLGQLVPVSLTRRRASTSGLSTSLSSRVLAGDSGPREVSSWSGLPA